MDIKIKIFRACYDGDKDLCEQLLNSGADINTKVSDWTLLHWAAKEGHKDVCALLMDRGIDVNAKNNSHGSTPLYWASYRGHYDVCVLLLDRGADMNAKGGWEGSTSLHDACYNGHKDVCKLLIDRGADVHARGKYDWTPRHYAHQKGYTDLCALLLFKMRQPLFELYIADVGSLLAEETISSSSSSTSSTSMAIEEASKLASIRKRDNIPRVEVDTERMGEFAYRFYNLPKHIMAKIIKNIA
jgi:ankyrin repeat protein